MYFITLKKGFIVYFIISVEISLYVYHLQLLIVVKYSFLWLTFAISCVIQVVEIFYLIYC